MSRKAKRVWVVTIEQIYDGHFYVAARSKEAARRLSWAHFQKGNELRSVNTRPGYLVKVGKVNGPQAALYAALEGGVDTDEDDSEYAALAPVPEVF